MFQNIRFFQIYETAGKIRRILAVLFGGGRKSSDGRLSSYWEVDGLVDGFWWMVLSCFCLHKGMEMV